MSATAGGTPDHARCGTCRWWRSLDWSREHAGDRPWDDLSLNVSLEDDGGVLVEPVDWDLDREDRPRAPGPWGTCERAENGGPASSSDRFYVRDASAFAAWLYTTADFGCVEHEQKAADG